MHVCTDVLLCLDVLHADRISRGKSKNCQLENWVEADTRLNVSPLVQLQLQTMCPSRREQGTGHP